MKLLFDIVHPANVLFFYNPIKILESQNHEIMIVSREKDITLELLKEFGLTGEPISTARNGIVGMVGEMIERDFNLLRVVRRYRPSVMAGFGGVAISHVGRLTGTPSVSFYDTEVASLQNAVTFPFITELHVPRCYTGKVPAAKTTRFPGYKALSYLHPNYFEADFDLAKRCGLDSSRDNFLIRLVEWRANHDIGKSGWRLSDLEGLIDKLAALGRVHISTERPLPGHLDEHQYRGELDKIHHLMSFCRLYVGESASMATEAAVLGVPAIYAADDYRSYTHELEDRGLVLNIADVSQAPLAAAIDKMLLLDRAHYAERRRCMLADTIDVAAYVAETLLKYDA